MGEVGEFGEFVPPHILFIFESISPSTETNSPNSPSPALGPQARYVQECNA
jgi:hypothetical protein